MTEKNWFYGRNDELINSEVNKTFDELLWMSQSDFRQWVIDMRKKVVDLWDNKGLPPRVGYSKKDIIDNFTEMTTFPVHELEVQKDVVRNTSIVGNAVNSWFPTMMKTGISYSSKGEARSIYTYFADDSLLDTFVTYATRHFKRDSFYHYSSPISVGEILQAGNINYTVTTPENFFLWFTENNIEENYGYSYWLCPVKEDGNYTGYNQALAKRQNLFVTADFDVPAKHKVNVDKTKTNKYSIRWFKLGQKVFPIGLKAFRVSFCQYAVQYPPLTARFIYEKFINPIKNQDTAIIWDPSAGWAGRLIGAMAMNDKKQIHYIGTDPNTDHNTTTGRTKYHEVADFFNQNIRESNSLFPKSHIYEIYQCGSEMMRTQPEFQKYKGKLDFVFTSPPYFNKEVYSDDKEQSCHKFSTYDSWRDGFLRPTLETAVEYLRNDRYLAWNIADIALDGKLLSLEEDSCNILKELGMKYITTIKMTLAPMPGGNRFVETGEKEIVTKNTVFGEETEEVSVTEGMMKNCVEVTSAGGKKMKLKYEPIYIYYKP
jgi:hypothetical protein